jgi:hypothetical protein
MPSTKFTWENKQTGNVSQYWKSILKGFGYYLEPALEMEAAIEAHGSNHTPWQLQLQKYRFYWILH